MNVTSIIATVSSVLFSGVLLASVATAETVRVGGEVENGRQGVDVSYGQYGLALGQSVDGQTTDLGVRYLHVMPVVNGLSARLGVEAGATSQPGNYKPAAYFAGFSQGLGIQVGQIGYFTDLTVHTSMDAATHQMAQGLTLAPRIGIELSI